MSKRRDRHMAKFGQHTEALNRRTRRAPSWFKKFSLKKRGLGLTVVALSTSLIAQGSLVTEASWNDQEWTHGNVGTLDCANPEGQLASRSEGRALSGQLLNVDLDDLAEVRGVEVTHDGEAASASAGSPVPNIDDAWADPLTVDALSAISVPLDGLLELPADNNTGVVGQFAQAQSTGDALSAAGYVTNSGGIDLESGTAGYPDLATLKLSEILDSDLLVGLELGSALANVADLELEVGALAGQAHLDGCEAAWAGAGQQVARPMAEQVVADVIPGLERNYLATSADLSFQSPTVGTLVTAIGGSSDDTCGQTGNGVLTNLECTLNGLAGSEGVVGTLTSGITDLLGTLTDGLGLGEIQVELSVDFNLDAVRNLLNDTLDDGVVSINLSNGAITIDTANLLTEANPSKYSNGLNGLPPNTNPLSDPDVVNELTNRISSMLASWIATVEETVDSALDAVLLHLNVNIYLQLTVDPPLLPASTIDIGHIQATVDCQPSDATTRGCTLGDLLDPELRDAVDATLILLPGLGNIPVLGPIIDLLINGVVGTLIATLIESLVDGLGSLLGTVVEDVLGVFRELPDAVTALTAPIVETVTGLYSGLFGGLDPVVSLTLNAQNDPTTGVAGPPDWESLEDGRYDVAAIRIGVLDGLGDYGVALYLGRASVGPVCLRGDDSASCLNY